MENTNLILGITNISSGILFILISIPLVMKKISMNPIYGFRIKKAFSSEENWFKINQYGGRQLILWSIALVGIGLSYFFYPPRQQFSEMAGVFYAVGPMCICAAVAIIKTVLYSKTLD